ncbi:MAG: ABC transporter permease [Planctomycetota bacterium]|nr:ABC transporter permease [Planctomycetota bacterium]
MSRFPPQIPRRSRTVYGFLGITAVLVVWTLLTMPVFTDTVEERRAVTNDAGDVVDYEVVRTERRYAVVNRPGLDTPWNTFRRANDDYIQIFRHIGRSTLRILLGFLISASLAVPLGISMGLFPRLRAALNPIVSFLRPIPSIAWVPLALIWLGVDEVQKLFIIFMGSFAAALIYTVEATLKVDPDLIRAAENLGVRKRQLLTKVLLPAALPSILSGLKVVMAICWTCVISAEIVGTSQGLGSLIWVRKEIADTAAIMVGIVCISLVVLVLDALFTLLERKLVPWMFLRERGE